jgi:hypothetical protein
VGWALVLFCFRNKIEVVNVQDRIYTRVFPKTIFICGVQQMQQSTSKMQKSYEEPTLRKLRPEQAKKFLLHHANMGDQGAKDILELVRHPRSDSSI